MNQNIMINQHNENGLSHGLWKHYYGERSQLMYIGTYENGKIHGLWEWYYHNGIADFKGEYKNGKSIGLWYRDKYND